MPDPLFLGLWVPETQEPSGFTLMDSRSHAHRVCSLRATSSMQGRLGHHCVPTRDRALCSLFCPTSPLALSVAL